MTTFTVVISDYFAYALISYASVKLVKIIKESVIYYRTNKELKKQ